jgi:hypothetical protein
MNRYSKTCRCFVKDEFPQRGGIKTLKKQNVELFAEKSQYELPGNIDLRNADQDVERVCRLALTM